MKHSKLRYTATLSAAAIFAATGSVGLAWADDDGDDDGEDEGDDDSGQVIDVCLPENLAAAIDQEVANNDAVKTAAKAVAQAEKKYNEAVKELAKKQAELDKAIAKGAKPKDIAKKQAEVDKAAAKVAKALADLNSKNANYTTVEASVRAAIESRYATQCGITPTPTPTNTVTPSPTPTTPTPTPTDTVTPSPTATVTASPTPTTSSSAPSGLAAPTGLVGGTALATRSGALRLSWNAVAGATTYSVYKDGALLGTTTALVYTPSVTPGVSYNFYVTASDGVNTSAPSATVKVSHIQGTSEVDGSGLVVYGNIRTNIVVTDGVMTGCWATYPTSGDSNSINTKAIPILCARAIALQNYNVAKVSGASYTTTAFRASIHNALITAGILK